MILSTKYLPLSFLHLTSVCEGEGLLFRAIRWTSHQKRRWATRGEGRLFSRPSQLLRWKASSSLCSCCWGRSLSVSGQRLLGRAESGGVNAMPSGSIVVSAETSLSPDGRWMTGRFALIMWDLIPYGGTPDLLGGTVEKIALNAVGWKRAGQISLICSLWLISTVCLYRGVFLLLVLGHRPPKKTYFGTVANIGYGPFNRGSKIKRFLKQRHKTTNLLVLKIMFPFLSMKNILT